MLIAKAHAHRRAVDVWIWGHHTVDGSIHRVIASSTASIVERRGGRESALSTSPGSCSRSPSLVRRTLISLFLSVQRPSWGSLWVLLNIVGVGTTYNYQYLNLINHTLPIDFPAS